ncbi:MAG: MoaD/ThiS family protein [Planctomycetota bacterium]
MSVTVRLYAGVKERAGRCELTVEADSIESLKAAVAAACPPIADHLAFCRFATNDEFVGEDTLLAPGATVDLIPPVSGG